MVSNNETMRNEMKYEIKDSQKSASKHNNNNINSQRLKYSQKYAECEQNGPEKVKPNANSVWGCVVVWVCVGATMLIASIKSFRISFQLKEFAF